MVQKSLVFFFFLVVAYELLLRLFEPSLEVKFTQWQENLVKAQKLMFSSGTKAKANTFIVGTSLSNKLNMSTLTKIQNISLSGMSIFDALNLLGRVEKYKDTVLIEMNIIGREENHEFYTKISHPVHCQLNSCLACTRQAYQPLGLVARYGLFAYQKVVSAGSTSNAGDDVKFTSDYNDQKSRADPRLQMTLKSLEIEYNTEIDSQILNRQMLKLSSQVEELRKKGTTVLFFEMPVNHTLVNLKRPKQIRNAFESVFPSSTFGYVAYDTSRYTTTDGVHLDFKESIRYSKFLKRALEPNNKWD